MNDWHNKTRISIAQMERLLPEKLLQAGVEGRGEAICQARLILEFVTGCSPTRRVVEGERALSLEQLSIIDDLLRRRRQGEPLQYCLGEAWFMGHRFVIRPGVFIPRSDTETLVEIVLRLLAPTEAPHLAEIGTGSGAIGLSILATRRDATLEACELSPAAFAVTLENAQRLGVSDRLILANADWREWLLQLPSPLDAFVSNPPYIPMCQSRSLAPEVLAEPHLALFGADEDGLDFYRQFARSLGGHLKPSGIVAVEVGDEQAAAVAEIFQATSWDDVVIESDLSGSARVVTARAGNLGSFKPS